MALIKKTPEQRAIEAGIKEQEREEQQRRREQAEAEQLAQKRAAQRDKMRKAFFATPAGKARLAFDCEDHVFQCSIDVTNQQAIVVAVTGADTWQQTSDPTQILNSVCNEGWELLNGSFVYKPMSSNQNVAKGATVGHYLFRRCDANRREIPNPWGEI